MIGIDRVIERAAIAINNAEIIVITAGAGMGVDSGLPDFRGVNGFWNAYPAYERLGLSFVDMAAPYHFKDDPKFAWGFYGHRTNLYRNAVPHEGFAIILKWIRSRNLPYFIVTSNVDGQFQRAGFAQERILEIHGSLHWLQCATPCSNKIWPNQEKFYIDATNMRSMHIPSCPYCGDVCRPNILMFEDCLWVPDRTNYQRELFRSFAMEHSIALHASLKRQKSNKRITIIEIGAGKTISNIRLTSEMLAKCSNAAQVIRINPREAKIKPPHISLPCGALEALRRIDELIS